MSLNIVTRGFGPSASIALVVTRGYTLATAADAAEVSTGGGWLPPEWHKHWDEVRQAEQKGRKERKAAEKKLEEIVRAAYEEITGRGTKKEISEPIVEEVKTEAAQVVKPFVSARAKAKIPTIPSINWGKLIQDIDAIRELMDIYSAAMAREELERQDEEDVLLLMAMD